VKLRKILTPLRSAEDQSTLDWLLRTTVPADTIPVVSETEEQTYQRQQRIIPADTYFIIANGIPPRSIVLTGAQISDLLDISAATLRGGVSKGLFPPKDGELNSKSQVWSLETVIEYVRNAPGGRLGYPVG